MAGDNEKIMGRNEKYEKVLFSELHTKSEKYWAKNFMYYPYHFLLYAILGVSIGLIYLSYGFLDGQCDIWDARCSLLTVLFLGILIALPLLYYHVFLYKSWIKITHSNVLLVIGDGHRIIKKIPVVHVKKIVLNLKKHRLEIHLNNGKMIKIKKGVWEIKSNFLFYDQFQRFKKAMEKIERPYEIIWP